MISLRLALTPITCFGDGALTMFGDIQPPILDYHNYINHKPGSQMQLFRSPLRLQLRIAFVAE